MWTCQSMSDVDSSGSISCSGSLDSVSAITISLPGLYLKTMSYFWSLSIKLCILGGQLLRDFLHAFKRFVIIFNIYRSSINELMKLFTGKDYTESFLFNLCVVSFSCV